MEPQASHQPGLELPVTPSGESKHVANELPPVRPESAPVPAAPAVPPVPPVNLASIQSTSTAAQSSSGTPQVADDVDLIEKEWVEKAKTIVNKTRHDPHAQNKEMNRFKADYLRKRYNKEIKLDES